MPSRMPSRGRRLRDWAPVVVAAVALVVPGVAGAAGAAADTPPAGRPTHVPGATTAVKAHNALPDQPELAGAFVPTAPKRLLDTRYGTGTDGVAARLGQAPLLLDVSGVTGSTSVVPTAVVLNVTATGSASASHLAVYPGSSQAPATSNLNFSAGQTVPNLVTVPVGTDGKVAFSNAFGRTDVIADLAGYYTLDKAAGTYLPQTPKRLLDTRYGTGAPGTAPVGPGGTVSLSVAGVAPVPAAGVSAVVLNVTVTAPTSNSFLTVYPHGGTLPNASNLNYVKGQTVSNLVTVAVGADGKVDFHNTYGSAHVIADLAGYYLTGSPQTGSVLQRTDAPTRVLDTRYGTGTGGAKAPVGANGTVGLKVTDTAGVPSTGVSAVVLNVTVTNPTTSSYLTVYPHGAALPNASTINFVKDQIVPNLVLVAVGADGKVDFHNAFGSTHVVADVLGYFSDSDHLALTSLGFDKTSVDVSDGSYASSALRWTVTDTDPAATQTGGEIVVRQQGDAPDTYVGQSYVISFSSEQDTYGGATHVSGDASSSTWSFDFGVPQYAGAAHARWVVSTVSVFESDTQARMLVSGSDLQHFGAGLDATEQISTVTPVYDLSIYSNFGGRPDYAYNANGGAVQYWVNVQDWQSGFWKGTVQLTGPGGRTLKGSFEMTNDGGQTAWPCQHDIHQATCLALVDIPAGAPAGTYAVTSVSLTNNAGQTKDFTGLDLAPVSVTDNSRLTASGFTTTPASLNSWRGAAPFQVSLNVAGAQGGVSAIEVYFGGAQGCTQKSTTPTALGNGVYSVPATLPQSRNGSAASCSLSGIAVHDGAGGLALYGTDYAAPDPKVTVTSVPDTVAPTASSAKLNITTVALSKFTDQQIYVTAHVTEGTAPVNQLASYVYDSTGAVIGQESGGTGVAPDGTLRIDLDWPYGIEAGTYTIGFTITDAGWRSASYGTPGGLPVPGGPLTLKVTEG